MCTIRIFALSILLVIVAVGGAVAPVSAMTPLDLLPSKDDDADLPVPPTIPEGTQIDLEHAVQRGLEANPAIVSARATLKGSEHNVKSSFADFFFDASASYGYTHYDRVPKSSGVRGDQDAWAATLSITQPLFKGFGLLSAYQRAQLSKDQNDARLYAAELQVISDVQTNFLALLKARMDVTSKQDAVTRLESQLKVVQAFYDVGLRPRVDVLDAEVELATAQQDLLTARNSYDTQVAKLNTLLNLPLTAEYDYVGQLAFFPFELGLDESLKRAYANRPDIAIGEKSVSIAEKDAKITAAGFYPSVDAQFNYNRAGAGLAGESDRLSTRQEENWDAGLSASWTFFEWGSNYYGHERDLQAVKSLQAELENTRLNAGFEVKRALLNIKAAADRVDVAKKSVAAAKEAYRQQVARYQAQVGTNTDVLNAQSRLSDSEFELITALADYHTAVSDLYIAMGEKNPGLTVQ